MKRKLIFLFAGIMLLTALSAMAQEAKEKKFEWTPEMDFKPPAEMLVGLENLGMIKTGDENLKITYPQVFKVVGDDLYVFDIIIEKLLLFTKDGKFKKSLFTKDQVIKNHIRQMDISKDGRVLLADHKDAYIFEKGKISEITLGDSLNGLAWKGNNIVGVNGYANERNEGVIQEFNLKGEELGSFGDYFNKKDRPWGATLRDGNKLYFLERNINALMIYDLDKRTSKKVEINHPAFLERIKQTKASIEYKEKTNARSWRTFPCFTTISVVDGTIYLGVFDKAFISVIAINETGKILKAYRGLKPEGENGSGFTVTKVDGNPYFYFMLGVYGRPNSDYHLYAYSPGGKVPTLADIKKKELTPEEKAKKAEMEKKRKVWDEVMAAENKSRTIEDPEKKKQVIFNVVRKYPNELNAGYMLGRVGGKDRDKATAKQVLAIHDELLPKVDEGEIKQIYLSNIIALTSELEMKGRMLATIDEYLKYDPDFFNYVRILQKLEKMELWTKILELSDFALTQSTDEKIMKRYGGMGKKALKEVKNRFISEYKVYKVRSLAHLDRAAEALPLVKEAAAISPKLYTGIYANNVDLAHAEALYFTGKKDEAIDAILKGALFSGSEEKEAFLRKIYADSGRKEDFEDFLWKQRLKLAKKIDDVTLYSLDRKPVKLSSKFGKATILTFWTPDT